MAVYTFHIAPRSYRIASRRIISDRIVSQAVEDAEKAERERILKLAAAAPTGSDGGEGGDNADADADADADGGGGKTEKDGQDGEGKPTAHHGDVGAVTGAVAEPAPSGAPASPVEEEEQKQGSSRPAHEPDTTLDTPAAQELGKPPEPPFVPLEGGSIYTSITAAQYARLTRDERRARRQRLREERRRQKRLDEARKALQAERGVAVEGLPVAKETRQEKVRAVRVM